MERENMISGNPQMPQDQPPQGNPQMPQGQMPQGQLPQGRPPQLQGGQPPRPPYPPRPQYVPKPEDSAETQRKSDFFQKMMMPTLVYALLYTFFLYNTLSGITMPMCVMATVAYCFYAFKVLNVEMKRGTYLYAGAMLLIGISSATTGNPYMIAMNTIALILMLVSMLVHNFCDNEKWGFVKSLGAICETFIYTIESLGTPFSDGKSYQKLNKKKAQSKSLYVLIGVAISVPLVIFIIVLLYQADAVFAEVIRKIFEDIDLNTVVGICFLFVFSFFCAYSGIRAFSKKRISSEVKDYRHQEPLIAITVLIIISIVYLFFSMIQILYLFLGKMELPANFTYAQYARQGFFQLLTVCILNVIIVLVGLGFFRKSKVLNVLLAIISGCTYIMLASSAFRMIMYVQNYGLTFMRLLVLWSIALIGILLVGILLQIFMERFPLFRYGLIVINIWFIALSFSHPDYSIAKYNLSDKVNQEEVDYEYLTRLSSDAAPVVSEHEGIWVERYVYNMTKYNNYSLRKYNFSRARALHIFKDRVSKLEGSYCVILREPEGFAFSNVQLICTEGDSQDSETMDFQTEKIPATNKETAGYIAYVPKPTYDEGDEDKFVGVKYLFDWEGMHCETDTCSIYPKEGKSYIIRMETYNHEDYRNEEPFYIYQDYSY